MRNIYGIEVAENRDITVTNEWLEEIAQSLGYNIYPINKVIREASKSVYNAEFNINDLYIDFPDYTIFYLRNNIINFLGIPLEESDIDMYNRISIFSQTGEELAVGT